MKILPRLLFLYWKPYLFDALTPVETTATASAKNVVVLDIIVMGQTREPEVGGGGSNQDGGAGIGTLCDTASGHCGGRKTSRR